MFLSLNYVLFSISWVAILILTKPREKNKKERWKDKRNRVERKREKKMVEMVDDQTVNQAANPLKKGKK
jgi:hypothetical protein